MSDIYTEIKAERNRQDAQWGGPEHDDQHIDGDWRRYRKGFEDKISLDYDPIRKRNALVKIAALTIAQIESLDRQHPLPPHTAGEEIRPRMTIDLPIPATAEERYPFPAASQSAPESELPDWVIKEVEYSRKLTKGAPIVVVPSREDQVIVKLADRVAELERELDTLQQRFRLSEEGRFKNAELAGVRLHEIHKWIARSGRAEERNDALQASAAQDTKRLDWLTGYPRTDVGLRWSRDVIGKWYKANPNGTCMSTESIREAIDAAMSHTGDEK